MMGQNKKYTRRDFNKKLVKTAALVSGYQMFCKKSPTDNGGYTGNAIVYVVNDEDAVTSSNEINQTVVQSMMDTGIRRMTGLENIGEAWKSLFPGITRKKKISIKVNCIARGEHTKGLATNPEVVFCIVNGLTGMEVDGAAFPEENIIVWDRSDFELRCADYSINKGSTGVKCFGTREEISRSGQRGGYSSTGHDVNGRTQYLSEILTDNTDYLINLSVFKNHTGSGVTLSLKNHYGSCWSPYSMHSSDGRCDPYIAALNALTPIRNKQVICICDAIYGIVTGGPMGPPQVTPKSLIFSKDSVALDTTGSIMLKNHGCNTVGLARHISTASMSPYNLGTNITSNIEVVNIENPSAGLEKVQSLPAVTGKFRVFQNYPNPVKEKTVFSYQLFKPAEVKLDIFDIQGKHILRLIDKHQGSGYYRKAVDRKFLKNSFTANGTFTAKFQIDNFSQDLHMHVV